MVRGAVSEGVATGEDAARLKSKIEDAPESYPERERSATRREPARRFSFWPMAMRRTGSQPPPGAPASCRRAREARDNADADETPTLPGRACPSP